MDDVDWPVTIIKDDFLLSDIQTTSSEFFVTEPLGICTFKTISASCASSPTTNISDNNAFYKTPSINNSLLKNPFNHSTISSTDYFGSEGISPCSSTYFSSESVSGSPKLKTPTVQYNTSHHLRSNFYSEKLSFESNDDETSNCLTYSDFDAVSANNNAMHLKLEDGTEITELQTLSSVSPSLYIDNHQKRINTDHSLVIMDLEQSHYHQHQPNANYHRVCNDNDEDDSEIMIHSNQIENKIFSVCDSPPAIHYDEIASPTNGTADEDLYSSNSSTSSSTTSNPQLKNREAILHEKMAPFPPTKIRSKMHDLAVKHRLITNQNTRSHGIIQLSAEEKRTLLQEGYHLPTRLPLTREEEEALKIVRRKIKNKLSAQESRRKRKEYIESLEKKVQLLYNDNVQLHNHIRQLETLNRDLLAQAKKFQQK